MPTLAILEDSPSALAQMRLALAHDASLSLQFHAPLGQTMIEWLSEHAVDILVVDLGLPDMSGLEVIRFCRERHPATEMLVCTLFEGDEAVFSCLRSGAGGYLLKADIALQFCSAVHQLLAGGAPMSPSIARRVLRQFQTQQNVAAPSWPPTESLDLEAVTQLQDAPDTQALPPTLTTKQVAILNLVARGFKYSEISEFLALSIHTVHSQLKVIYKKLEVNSRAEAVYEARLLQLLK